MGEDNVNFPILITNPHSGRDYSYFTKKNKHNLLNLRKMEDSYIDLLLSGLEDNELRILASNTPRTLIDLNRHHNEIDKELFFNCPLENIKRTKNVDSGYGLFFSRMNNQDSIYDTKLDWNELSKRISDEYIVFHQEIRNIYQQGLRNFNEFYLLDFHSMPSYMEGYNFSIPEICIGDNIGKSSSIEFKNFLINKFKSEGFIVGENKPFSGGFITKNYGSPNNKVNALQIEIRKDTYLNENNLSLNRNFFELKNKIEKILEEVKEFKVMDNIIKRKLSIV